MSHVCESAEACRVLCESLPMAYIFGEPEAAEGDSAESQIKIRGMRVELGEIENVLSSDPFVKEVQVSVVKHEATQQPTVVAYATPATVNTEAVLDASTTQLPEHMVPATVIPLEEMPLLPSGKASAPAGRFFSLRVAPRCQGRFFTHD